MRSQWFHARLDATIHDHTKADAMTASRLFSPITLRGLTLDNRIVLSPMCQYASQDGNPSPWHTVHLGTYALANLGLAITEATAVEPARAGHIALRMSCRGCGRPPACLRGSHPVDFVGSSRINERDRLRACDGAAQQDG
jgi:NADH:flavin oxidoreductase / NADH oxidase family